jgi:putative FmdB family regulatory protein
MVGGPAEDEEHRRHRRRPRAARHVRALRAVQRPPSERSLPGQGPRRKLRAAHLQSIRGMPLYQFRCDRCGLRFDERMTTVEHDQNRPDCPRCHSSERVHAEPATFTAITARKS